MWSSSKTTNMSYGVPEELKFKYPLIFNDIYYIINGKAEQYDNSIKPMIAPAIRTSYSSTCERYIYTLIYPMSAHNIPINIYIGQGIVNYSDRWNDQYGIVYHDSTVRSVEQNCDAVFNAGLTTIIGTEVCVSRSERIIYISNSDNVASTIHKAVACLYNLVKEKPECLSRLYTELFNYSQTFLVHYISWLDTWYDKEAETYEDRLLESAITNITNGRVRVLNEEIESKKARIEGLEQNLQGLYNDLMRLQESYIGAKYNADTNGTNELKAAFKRCKNIKNITHHNGYLILNFVSPLFNYNLDAATRWCSQDNNLFANTDTQDLMYKLLVSGKYTLMLEAYICWRGDTTFERAVMDKQYSVCPQPHIEYYNCFGDNKAQIQEALAGAEYALALDCMNASVSSLNINDVPVMQRLIDWLRHNEDVACVQNNETGEIITIKEMLEDDSVNRPTA